jgi:hypothetical protein
VSQNQTSYRLFVAPEKHIITAVSACQELIGRPAGFSKCAKKAFDIRKMAENGNPSSLQALLLCLFS